jgi:hypothetical protein
LTEFEKDIQLKQRPDAGLREAKAALQVVEKIYRQSGFNFDSPRQNPKSQFPETRIPDPNPT